MPTYDYRCSKCGHQFEVSQRMSDEPLTECEVCGGQVSKVLFAPAIHFKGTGFHNTDYASKRRGAGDDAGGAGSGTGEGSSSKGASSGEGKTSSAAPATAGSGSSGGKTVGLDKV